MRKMLKRSFICVIAVVLFGIVMASPVLAAGTLTRDGNTVIFQYADVGVEIETVGFENNIRVTSSEEKTNPFYATFQDIMTDQDPVCYYNTLYVNGEMTMRKGDSVTLRIYSSAPKDIWEWHSLDPEECEYFRCQYHVDFWYYNPDRNLWVPAYGHSDYTAEYIEYTFSAPDDMDKIVISAFADYEMRVEITAYVGDYAESAGYDLPGGGSSGGSSGSSGSSGSNSSSGSSGSQPSESGGSKWIGTVVKTVGGVAVTFVVVKMGSGVIKIFKKSANKDDLKRVKAEREAQENAWRKQQEEEQKRKQAEEEQRRKDQAWTHQQAQKLAQRNTEFDRKLDEAEKKYKEGQKKLAKEARWNQVGLKYGVVGDEDANRRAVVKDMKDNEYTAKLMIEKANNYDTAITVAEGIVTVADVSVSALSNVTGPLGPVINDVYTAGKNFGSKLSEARYGNGDYSTAFWQAATESLIDIAQNHANITEGSLGDMAKQVGFNVVSNVGGEGFKAGLNSYIEGKDWSEILVDTGSGMGQGAMNSFFDIGGSVGNTLTNDAVASRARATYDRGRKALEVGRKNGLSAKTYNNQFGILARQMIDSVDKGQMVSDMSWDIMKNVGKKGTDAVREKITDAVKEKLF
ncbi:MAG: cell envelope integrity protein TolA [Oscillospiraceae bacterium]|nr:cell envelope integrity protein TolA [Oscillospiraceae bacterium]